MQDDLEDYSFANLFLLPPNDSFVDRDVQSLLGFHTLFYYFSPPNDNNWKMELTKKSSFEFCFPTDVYRDKSDLMLVLENPHVIIFHYILGRHFVASYLRLRCCIDCNIPYIKPRTEFSSQRIQFPFEHIIRRFYLRKLRMSKK